ncbi:MAG: VOC family protein [Burkholderiaceae bacterium]|jgi:2,3-dihydroxybiphenyl 1,2-dioxygenase|nr:VOC family protein [Burkholderiaceae bacterium]
MDIENLGYWVLGVADVKAWASFAHEVVGMQAGSVEADGSLALRADGYRQRILLLPHADDDILEVGWEFATPNELTAFITRLKAAGVAVEEAGEQARKQRRVRRLFWCADPAGGFRHGFYYGADLAADYEPFRPGAGTGAGFETGPLGLGHFVAITKDYEASVAFYRDVLQLRVSDFIREKVAPDKEIELTFFHTRTGRHHSLAVGSVASSSKRTSHLMLQYKRMDDVGLAYDRCVRAGHTIVMALGHHPNDRMFSFYVKTPSGFALELGYGGIVIDDAQWSIVTHPKRSDWGHELFPRDAALRPA